MNYTTDGKSDVKFSLVWSGSSEDSLVSKSEILLVVTFLPSGTSAYALMMISCIAFTKDVWDSKIEVTCESYEKSSKNNEIHDICFDQTQQNFDRMHQQKAKQKLRIS